MILASGYYAAFRVTLVAKALEGMYDGAIHITTDYEVGRHSDLLFFQNKMHKQHSLDYNGDCCLPSDINHPGESSHCCRDFKQLSQAHHITTFIPSK